MKRALSALFLAPLVFAVVAQAGENSPVDQGSERHYFRPHSGVIEGSTGLDNSVIEESTGLDNSGVERRRGINLTYHGGPVILSAKAVFIFWGPSFQNPASPDFQYAQTLIAFRNQFGTTPEFNVITQYYQNLGSGNQFIQLTNLGSGTPDWFDTSTPPTNVTDAIVQSEVNAYLATHAFDASTSYQVFIPSTSYSSDGGGTSCGGPALQYCAYHGFFNSGGNAVKYAIEPYPSCSGCQVAGWTAVENEEHFVCHETRETVTDQQLNAWYDSRGNEADDKCAWSPTPFIGTGGYAYQYEWSNAATGCVKTR